MVHKKCMNTQRTFPCAAILFGGLLLLGNGCNNDTAEVAPRAGSHEVSPAPTVEAFEPELGDQPDEGVEAEEDVELPSGTSISEIAKLKGRAKGQALDNHLGAAGFKPRNNPSADFYGQRTRFRDPDQQNRITTRTIVLQNYDKEGSTDAAAIATVTISTREGPQVDTDTYDFVLIAPEGDPENFIELTVDEDGTVVEANSWFSCVWNGIKARCVGTCVSALNDCKPALAFSWAAYVGCLALKCGVCLTKVMACCECNCRWWCRWAAGCCNR
jgi:hypothetical protein